MSSIPEITIVMPCLNEAQTLKACIVEGLKAFSDNHLNGEIIIADNGSTDGSQDIAIANGARVVHVREKGYGNALRAGIEAAKSEFILMGDADSSYDFGHVRFFVDELRKGYDLVMGNRFRGGIQPGAMPWKTDISATQFFPPLDASFSLARARIFTVVSAPLPKPPSIKWHYAPAAWSSLPKWSSVPPC
jgi:glycosyltransferase involved in cell wall biosynthesis